MRYNRLLLLWLLTMVSCGMFRAGNEPVRADVKVGSQGLRYTIALPRRWAALDTVMQGLRVLLVLGPASREQDKPRVNIITMDMGGRSLEDFTRSNKRYLEQHGEHVLIGGQGSMSIKGRAAQWFTYTREQDGVRRDMINYIIPSGGSACMITCGVHAGSMERYRSTFDKMTRSLRIK